MKKKIKKTIILASASPRRKELLKKIIKTFLIVPSDIDESKILAKDPEAFVVKAAIAKAQEVAGKKKNSIIIGADTIVVIGAKILGKPKSKKDAISILNSLSGKTHKVITGIAVVDSDTQTIKSDYEATKVNMKPLSSSQILNYVNSGKPMDKAGAYGIQEIEPEFIRKIEGSYDNVVGLPVEKLKKILADFIS